MPRSTSQKQGCNHYKIALDVMGSGCRLTLHPAGFTISKKRAHVLGVNHAGNDSQEKVRDVEKWAVSD